MAKSMSYEGARVIKVTGYFVMRKGDGAFMNATAEVQQDMLDEMIGFNDLDELTLTEMPNATVTKQGIRVDQ